jgi:hypothetical protein
MVHQYLIIHGILYREVSLWWYHSKNECTFLCMSILAHLITALAPNIYKFCDTRSCYGWRNIKSTSDAHLLMCIRDSNLCVVLNESISFLIDSFHLWFHRCCLLFHLNVCTHWITSFLHLCIIQLDGILWILVCSVTSDHRSQMTACCSAVEPTCSYCEFTWFIHSWFSEYGSRTIFLNEMSFHAVVMIACPFLC